MTDSMEQLHKALTELNAKREKSGRPPVDDLLRIHLIEFYSHGVYTGIEMYYERLKKSREEVDASITTEIAPKA